MSSTLELKLRTAASAYAPLNSLLGTSPFRWFEIQLPAGTLLPAVTVQMTSGSPTYVNTGRLATGFSRMQFTIWDLSAEGARAVENALLRFLDQFNAIGISGLVHYPNQVVLQRQGYYPTPAPPQFQRINDAMIFDNANL